MQKHPQLLILVALWLQFLESYHNLKHRFLFQHHKTLGCTIYQKNLQENHGLSVHHEINRNLKWYHQVLNRQKTQQYLLENQSVVARLHILHQTILWLYQLLFVLQYQQLHNLHNIFFQDILQHIYWLKQNLAQALLVHLQSFQRLSTLNHLFVFLFLPE